MGTNLPRFKRACDTGTQSTGAKGGTIVKNVKSLYRRAVLPFYRVPLRAELAGWGLFAVAADVMTQASGALVGAQIALAAGAAVVSHRLAHRGMGD